MEVHIRKGDELNRECDYSKVLGLSGAEIGSRVLLHSCCGPCSTSVIERLVETYKVTVFFYNPCITDEEEYYKRKENQIKFIDAYNEKLSQNNKISFIEGEYTPDEYMNIVAGYSNEPEGGRRCTLCFDMRLMRTAEEAKKLDFDCFATTLTVSPHKNYSLISELGRAAAKKTGVAFLDIDFKKKAGFQRSIQLSKEYNLYRQNYCGCQFSKR